MLRPLVLAAVLILPLTAAQAQQAAPTTTPAPAEISIDPAAPVNATPKQANLLTGLYATKAIIEICAITVDENATSRMNNDQKRFEAGLGMDDAAATQAYAKIKADVERTTPDCAEGGADRQNAEAVVNIYAAMKSGS
ncbi:hypothetical protein [Devosia sp. 1566]|uniref:hypothetical protein n=1 Tax=Devosia sp. 1566 TaxID=2499144 RepID=UPI000FD7BEBB|nr:hypothetical protein [Devosia sp. 1566]